MKNFLKILKIDEYSLTPYYRQLCNCIYRGLEDGFIEANDTLPSINDLSVALDISRSIVTKAYYTLKNAGVVNSVPGKGYFVSNTHHDRSTKVLLLFNKLSTHKKMIYDAFAEALGSRASIDFYIYNNSVGFFKKLLLEKQEEYDKIVIVPHFVDDAATTHTIINHIPKKKLILLGKLMDGVEGDFGAVYEDFENDIYTALEGLKESIKKYNSCTIVFPQNSYYSSGILIGFLKFCKHNQFESRIIPDLKEETTLTHSVYITLTENDLVELILRSLSEQRILARDIGIISYNEIPLKRFILKGITTISADFEFMGKYAADLVLNNTTDHIKVPFHTTVRNSL